MMTWSFHDADGIFTGQRFNGDESMLKANTPAGCTAIEGVFDHLSQRVDIATGKVIDYQPAKPADTELATYDWDATAKRWIGTPTAKAIAQAQQRAMETAVQAHLDAQAQALGYDSIRSAVTYADEPAVLKFQAEGQAFRAWRSQVWAHCYQVLADVDAGTRAAPSAEDLIAELPALVLPATDNTTTTGGSTS